MRRLLSAALLITVIGCGGGGGSNGNRISNLDGVWRGNLSLVLDQCFLAVNPLAEIHEIAIDGNQVMLIAQDGRILEGLATSADQFEVEISDDAAFPTIDRINYSSISNGVAQVSVSHILSRPGGCVTTWEGSMEKE